MDNRRQVEALRAANRGMARAVCQGAKTAKRYAALGAGMEVDAQGYGREPTAMVRGVLSCLFVCLFVPNPRCNTKNIQMNSISSKPGLDQYTGQIGLLKTPIAYMHGIRATNG